MEYEDFSPPANGRAGAAPEAPGEFTKSLRAGAYGARSQLQSAAGLTAEALGFDEFAKARAADAEALQAQAQENAPRIGSYKQVGGLRDAGDYITGLVGSSLPVMTAGVIGGLATGGRGAIPAMLGATAATAPFEMGDLAQKQNADPEAMKAPAGTRFRDMAVGGLASAGVQSLVPGMVGHQILGKAASSVGKRSLGGILAHNAMDIPLEGLTEGAGEAIKQYGANQDKPLDWEAIKENVVGGAAAGGAFAGMGAGADLAHSRAGAAVDAARALPGSINDRLAQAKAATTGAADTVAQEAPKKFSSVMDDLSSMLAKGRESADDGIDKLRDGTPFGDLKDFATEQGQALSDSAAVQKMQEVGGQMLNSTGLSPERRQQVTDALASAGERTSQVTMAGLAQAYHAGQSALAKVKALRESFARRDVDVGATDITNARIGNGDITDVTPIKNSNDFSGINSVIADQITPLLAHSQPELAGNPEAMHALADSARSAVTTLPLHPLSANTEFRLTDALGADTAATLDKAFRAVGETDPAKTETFYKNLNEIAALQQRSATLQEFVGGALVPESQGLIKTGQLGELTQMLVSRARGEGVDPNAGPHQRAAEDRNFRALMAEHFGDKADAVSLKIEKEAGIRVKQETVKEGEFNDDGEMIKAENLDVIRKGRGPKNDPVMDPALFKSRQMPGQNYAEQYMKDMQAKYPPESGRRIRFERLEGGPTDPNAEGYGMGHVVAEKAANPEVFSDADLQGMRLDTKKYPNSRDRINVGDMALDTRRIAKTMDRRLEYSEGDGQSRAHRVAHMFTEGLARLTEKYGNFAVPDTAVIGKVGNKDFTYGEAKKLQSDTASNADGRAEAETPDARLSRLERTVKNTELDILNNGMTKERRAAWGDAKVKYEEAAAEDRVARDLDARGITERSKDEQISQAAIGRGVNQEPVKANMDGTAHSHNASDRTTVNVNFLKIAAKDWAQGSSAPAKAIAARTEVLLANFGKMAEADQRRLASLGGDAKIPAASAAEASSIVNALARKYKDVIVAPKGETPGVQPISADGGKPLPKSLAAKKAALLAAASSSDPALLKELSTSDDAKALQRAAGVMPDGKALDAANARLSTLVQDPDVAYGLGTKKYSLQGTAIHNDLGRDGFAATHDSPIRHEGKFDWRAHIGKGEGNASFGAGTYLSTAEGVHQNYKRAFTALSSDDDFAYEMGGDKSPTYEVSVNIKPEQLLDWDKPLSGQSAAVREAVAIASKDLSPWSEDVSPGRWLAPGADPSTTMTIKEVGGDFHLQDHEYIYGKFRTLADAQQSAKDQKLVGQPTLRRGEDLYTTLSTTLGSQAKASEYLQSLGIPGHKYASGGGRDDAHPNFVIYDDAKISTNYVHFSAQTNGTAAHTAQQRADVATYLDKVLGQSVKRAWANIPHAGDFDSTQNLIRLSVHALDPLSTANHEALHALFDQLRKTGSADITRVLEKAANTEHYLKQMREVFKNEPAVLAQLADPEERAAYMYQLWAAGKLQTGPQVNTLFGKIAAAIRKVLGLWSNDERALHILDHFNSGEYAKNMGSPSAVRRALMEPGTNQAFEAVKSMVAPLTKLADAVVSTGSARLRDAGIPALNDLADLIKREHTDGSGKDQGFIPAARIESTKRRTALGEALKDYTPEQLQDAMNAMQRGEKAAGPEARLAQRAIQGVLKETRDYMVKAGVEIGDLGPDYFPRVWDTHYISKHQAAFKDMLEPYVKSGEFKGNVDEFIRQLGTREGNEFGIETRTPGMQFKKERVLSFIKAEDAAGFVNKDLFGTLNSYVGQATRRAEWNRRLGDGKLETLMTDATAQGATPEQLQLADNYLKGVDGTLGDGLNPHARRIMGNMIVYQNIRLLPMAMFSSLVDPMGVLVRGGDMKDAWSTFKRGMSEIPESFGRKGKADEAARLAELVGVVDSAMLSSTMGDMYSQGMVGGTAQKVNNWFFRVNMMEGLTRSFRVGASEAAMKFIAAHAEGTKSKHSQRWINELGLQAGDVKMTPDGRIALTEGEGLSAKQVTRVHQAVNQWVDGAMLRPDAADKPVWMNDPHYALIAHLKQFVYSFQKNIIGRVIHEYEHGNYAPGMALASYVPIMMAADFAKGMLQGGGDQPEWKKGWGMEDYVGYGVQRAGLLGVGQFGYDVQQNIHRGGLGVGALVGPTVEQFANVVQLLGGHKQFGPMLLDAMPANALYAHSLGGDSKADPMFAD